MVEEKQRAYRYQCDTDSGDVRCEWSYEAEDMAHVREEARAHHLAEHNREEDFDPRVLDGLIIMTGPEG